MIDLLEELGLAVGTITRADAVQAADAVNSRVMALVNAQVIKLYWKEEAQQGLLLRPFTYTNRTEHKDPLPFELKSEPNGVLSWVFLNNEPIWLEDLQNTDLTKPIKNRATGQEIEPQYLDVQGNSTMASTMCIPLTVRGEVGGLYAVELNVSGRLNKNVLALMKRLGKSLASFICNADFYAFDQLKTNRAIGQFLDSIANVKFDPVLIEERFRAGFIARPFSAEFSEVENRIVALLKSLAIQARHYQPEGGGRWMIEEIMKQIRTSHFCIADITGSNPNVLAETGMMMILDKPFLLLRKNGDPAPIPFNLNQVPLYEYQLSGKDDSLQIRNAADNQFHPFNVDIEKFIDQLPPETGFFLANKWPG